MTDDATGALSKSTDEIRENAEAWRHNAEVQANMDMYTRSLEEQAKASYDLEKAQDRVRQIREAMDEAALSGDYQGVVDMVDDLREAEQAVDDLTVAYDESTEMVEHFDEAARLSAANLGPTMTSAYEELPDALREKGAEVAGALQEGIDSGAVNAAEAGVLPVGHRRLRGRGTPPVLPPGGHGRRARAGPGPSRPGPSPWTRPRRYWPLPARGTSPACRRTWRATGPGRWAALASSLQSAPVTEAANQLRWSCQAELGMLPEGARSAGESAVQQLAQAVANGQITSAQAAQVLVAAVLRRALGPPVGPRRLRDRGGGRAGRRARRHLACVLRRRVARVGRGAGRLGPPERAPDVGHERGGRVRRRRVRRKGADGGLREDARRGPPPR